MPKLPDYTALPTKTPEPAHALATYTAPQIFAPSWQSNPLIGIGAEISGVAAEKQKEKDQIDEATANADMQIARDKIKEQEIANPDYANAPGRVSQQLDQTTAGIAQRFTSPRLQQLWLQQQRGHNETERMQFSMFARKRWEEDYQLADDQKIEEIGKSALQEIDPFKRYDKLKTIDGIIGAEVNLNILSKAGAEARIRTYRDKFAYAFELDEMRRDPIGYKKKLDSMYPDGFEDTAPPEGSTLAKQRKTMTDVGEMVSPLLRDRPTGRYFDPNTGKFYDPKGEPLQDKPDLRSDVGRTDEYSARTIQLESGGKTGQRTGSYVGLGQFSASEQRRFGITNPDDRAQVSQALKREAAQNAPVIERAIGRTPSSAELYLAHQQGLAGIISHLTNPNQAAWESMAQTAEGRQKGARWAKQAIWGNMTPQMKARFPEGVDAVTSEDFVNLWRARYARSDLYQIGPGA